MHEQHGQKLQEIEMNGFYIWRDILHSLNDDDE